MAYICQNIRYLLSGLRLGKAYFSTIGFLVWIFFEENEADLILTHYF